MKKAFTCSNVNTRNINEVIRTLLYVNIDVHDTHTLANTNI